MRVRLAFCMIALCVACLAPLPAAAHANLERAEPGFGATVPTAPTTIRLYFSETPEPRYSEVAVYDANRARYDAGAPYPLPGAPDALAVRVRDLPDGVYTAVWRTVSAVDGHNTGGSFAFVVGMGSLAGEAGQSQTAFAAPQPPDVAVRWLTYAAASTLVGSLALWLLVWQPTLAAADTATRRRLFPSVGRRLLLLAAGAATLLLPATVAGLLVQLTKGTGGGLADALMPAMLGDFLFATRAGSIWLLRLVLALGAAAALLPVAIRTMRGDVPATPSAIPASLGIVFGANGLLATSLLSHAAATAFLPALAVATDWLHLLATAVWVGGLAGLALTVPLVIESEVRTTLRGVFVRFSTLALVGVGVLTLTGLYSAWLHVGTPANVPDTEYGQVLAAKVALFGVLVALGAINLLRVQPRLAGTDAGKTARRFVRVIGAEVAAGAAVLLAVAILTGTVPSREAVAQGASPLAQTMAAGDLRVTLAPNTLAPGPISYTARVVHDNAPLTDAARVTFRFASAALGVEETEAVAENRGDGRYTVTGPYTALAGPWETRVIVRRLARDDVSTTFTLPIGGTLPRPAEADSTPRLSLGVVAWGVVAMLAVVLSLAVAARMGQRLVARTDRGTAASATSARTERAEVAGKR